MMQINVQDLFDYLVSGPRDLNLKPGDRLNMNPTQPTSRYSQERSDVYMATIILHLTYVGAESKIVCLLQARAR